MNFQTILEELDKLYEEDQVKKPEKTQDTGKTSSTTNEPAPTRDNGELGEGIFGSKKASKEILAKDLKPGMVLDDGAKTKIKTVAPTTANNKQYITITYKNGGEEDLEPTEKVKVFESIDYNGTLKEEADEEILIDDEPITDDEAADEDVQLVLECDNCGAIIIKSETEVTVDEKTDLANVDESCQYCEDSEGYKIIGTLAPYGEVTESLREGSAFEIDIKSPSTNPDSFEDKKAFETAYKELRELSAEYEASKASNTAVSKNDTGKAKKIVELRKKVNDLADVLRNKHGYQDSYFTKLPGNLLARGSQPTYSKDVLKKYDKKVADENLEELLDANVNLSLDGGTGNDVNVL